MISIVRRLESAANSLDSKGHRDLAARVDVLLVKFAAASFYGEKSAKSPEERARQRMIMMGQDDDALYKKLLAEEVQKEKDKNQNDKKPDVKKSEPTTSPIINSTKKELLAQVKNPGKEAEIRSKLVPALNIWLNDGKAPAPDVYGPKLIGEILDHAEKVGLIKKEPKGFFSRLFD